MIRTPRRWGLLGLRYVTRKPKVFLGAVVILLLLILPGVNKVKVLLSVSEMLSDSENSRGRRDLLNDKFQVGEPLAIVFRSVDQESLTSRQICAIKLWIDEQNLRNLGVLRIDSVFGVRRAEYDADTATLLYKPVVLANCLRDNRATLEGVTGSLWQGLFVDTDRQSLVVEFQIRRNALEGRYGNFPDQTISGILSSASKLGTDHGLTASAQGTGAFKHYFLESLTKDQVVNLVIGLILVLGFRIIFGTWRGGMLLVGTEMITVIVIFGIMGIFGSPTDILSNSLFAIVALSATEDFLFLTVALAEVPPGAYRTTFRKLLLPCFYTSMTTVIGFLSLLSSDMLPIQRLGLWAAIGAALEWGMCFFVLPALMSLFPVLRQCVRLERSWLRRPVATWSLVTIPRPLKATIVLLSAVSFVGLTQIESNDDLRQMWDRDHIFTKGVAAVKKDFGFEGQFELLIPRRGSPPPEGFWAELARDKNIVRVETVSALLEDTSVRLSDDRLKRLVHRELIDGVPLRRYLSDDREWERVLLYLSSIDAESLRASRQVINEACAPLGCFLAGELATHSVFGDETITTLISSFFLSLLLVAMVILGLAVALGVGHGPALVLSSMWGPLTLLGLTPILLGGINFVSCVFAAVLVGLAGDNGIQFMFATGREGLKGGLEKKQSSSLVVTMLLVVGSLAYLVSDFKQPRVLGMMFCLGYIFLFVGDVWILRWILEGTNKAKESPCGHCVET